MRFSDLNAAIRQLTVPRIVLDAPAIVGSFAALLFIASAMPAAAAVILVDWAGGGDYMTIGEGVGAAAPGDTVVVACGTYHEPCIGIEEDIYLRSETGAPDCVTIDPQHKDRALFCRYLTEATTIEGFTFVNGYQSSEWSDGGAIACALCSHTIRNCVFRDNHCEGDAGALFASTGMLIEDCRFLDNTAGTWGGAVYCQTCVIRDCLFTGNQAYTGGAIACDIHTATLLEGSTLAGNSASFGGAITCSIASHTTVRGCTLIGNASLPSNGGVHVSSATLTMENSIVAFGIGGSAVACPYGNEAMLVCCDLFGNAGGDWVDCVAGQLDVNGNDCSDPLFCGEANPDESWTLHANSPCAPANSPCGELIGSWGVGCAATSVEPLSWGSIKALYRR